MFERNFPFNQMEPREGYVFIPNIWVRNEKLPSGATYEDCFAYMISDKPKPNYHIHPAFVTNGKPNDTGLLIGTDIIAVSLAYTDLKSKAAEYDAEPFNIYDMHILTRLMLIEFGTGNIQKALSGIDGKMSATWHGIKISGVQKISGSGTTGSRPKTAQSTFSITKWTAQWLIRK